MIALSQTTLSQLGPRVGVPSYDRAAVKPGVVHFGVGNFHRVHLAVYLDRCLAEPGAAAWGICGVELMDSPANRAKAEAYARQDNLYTVTECAPDGSEEVRVIGAMVKYLHAPADPEAVLRQLADPATKIVSLTITEGGYNLDEATGEFVLTAPGVASDLSGAPPQTAFGFITEGLARRRRAGLPAYTVMSCDNLRHNGETARKAIVSFARARDAELGAWIDREAAFPNSMVDRIAPQVPEPVRQSLNERSGVDDAVPALGEDFMQFVLEDRFSDGRPELGAAGVELRDDVGLFEVMKQRVLNASHMMLGYPGLLVGLRIVHEAMAEDRFYRLLDSFQVNDVLPHLEAPRGVALAPYKDKVLERFKNPAIGDQLQRISLDGWAKFPIYHGKILQNLLEAGADLRREAFFLACIERYLSGRDDKGETFTVHEPHIGEEDWALIRNDDPVGFLRGSPFVNLGLADHPQFRPLFLGFRDAMAREGCAPVLERLLAETGSSLTAGMDAAAHDAIAAWLVESGLHGVGEQELLHGFCRRCAAAGLPLTRGLAIIDTLHPVYEGRAFRWRADNVDEPAMIEYGRTTEGEAAAAWRQSVFFHMIESGRDELAIDLREPGTERFTNLDLYKDEGHTGFLSLIHRFRETGVIGEMDCVYTTWCTRGATGFLPEERAALRGLVPTLALALKCRSLTRIAGTLVEVYLGRDAGQRVLSGRIQRGVADRISAVLWFSDLRGYTSISERAQPEEILPLLNDYADAVISAVHEAGGSVLKLVGDGVLATFTDADPGAAATAALAAEADLRGRLAGVNARRSAEGRPTTEVYLGLHCGEVYYGNIGSEDRLDFTVIGPAVNEVSRIAALCRSVDRNALASSDFVAAVPEADRGRLVSVGRYALRGVGAAKDLYTPDVT